MLFCRLRIHQYIVDKMITKSSKYSWNMLFMSVVKVAGALHSPKGITRNSSDP